MKVQIDSTLCQGHNRCLDLAPDLFEDDELGYAHIVGDGEVPPGMERAAELAESNCPEMAITLSP